MFTTFKILIKFTFLLSLNNILSKYNNKFIFEFLFKLSAAYRYRSTSFEDSLRSLPFTMFMRIDCGCVRVVYITSDSQFLI